MKAPFDGTIITRSAEPGEVVTAGTTIVTVLDLRKIYLRGYVPEGRIGKVRLGQPARIYLDSQPDHPFEAYVSRVDPQATFTPENTYFKDDRVKQVVGVKLQLKESLGFAKPGMPADGEILLSGDRGQRRRSADEQRSPNSALTGRCVPGHFRRACHSRFEAVEALRHSTSRSRNRPGGKRSAKSSV